MQISEAVISLLVVDDDKMARDVISLIIAREFPNSTIYLAENGKTGLELFKEHTPDIVITDINMPVMDGIQMVSEIKSVKDNTRFIVLTGYSDEDYTAQFCELGVKECIVKPIVFKRLFNAIENCLDEMTLEQR
jgi:YesN/AraC family two-component response regulator